MTISSLYVQSKEKDILESALITSTIASEETYYSKCVDVTYSDEVVQKFQSREGASATKYLSEAETPDAIIPKEGYQKNTSNYSCAFVWSSLRHGSFKGDCRGL